MSYVVWLEDSERVVWLKYGLGDVVDVVGVGRKGAVILKRLKGVGC